MKDANARLVITDSEGFENDIWQTSSGFTVAQWREALNGFAETIAEAREELERLDPDTYECGDALTYALSDIENFFLSLDVRKVGK